MDDKLRADLDAAIAAGVIDAQQAERLTAFLATRHGVAVVNPDDERFRLIGGFNDVFVSIGLVLVAAAISFFGGGFFGLGIGAALAWAFAELFTRRLRMALPSIVLSLLFAASIATTVAVMASGGNHRAMAPVAGLATAFAMILHARRFHTPIDMALVAASLLGALSGILELAAPGFLWTHVGSIALLCGLAVFAFAMRYDLADPQRVTRRSDVAFWLHLLAAPMIVHGLLAGLFGVSRLGGENVPAVLVTIGVVTLVALVIDRRALIVSALTYAGGAVYVLFKNVGSVSSSVALTLLALGAAVLALSVFWRALRARIVPLLPLGGLARRLPPLQSP